MIPPEQDANFVAKMGDVLLEDVLPVYRRPYDPDRPVVCSDEMSRQLLGHDSDPIEAKPRTPHRHDHHYERNGTANLFMFFEPLAAHCVVLTRDRRTKVDWVECVRESLDERYSNVEKVVLVMDNLNTHGLSSLYEAFAPAEARRLSLRLSGSKFTTRRSMAVGLSWRRSSNLSWPGRPSAAGFPTERKWIAERSRGETSAMRRRPPSTGSSEPRTPGSS